MLTRREWLRNAALVAAGVIAADQLQILDRLAPRSLFASSAIGGPPKLWGDGIHDDTAAMQWRIDRSGYVIDGGVYRISQPLDLTNAPEGVRIRNCEIRGTHNGPALISFAPQQYANHSFAMADV